MRRHDRKDAPALKLDDPIGLLTDVRIVSHHQEGMTGLVNDPGAT